MPPPLTPPTEGGEGFVMAPAISWSIRQKGKRSVGAMQKGIQEGAALYCTKKLSQKIKVRQEARVFMVTAALASSMEPCISLAIT